MIPIRLYASGSQVWKPEIAAPLCVPASFMPVDRREHLHGTAFAANKDDKSSSSEAPRRPVLYGKRIASRSGMS